MRARVVAGVSALVMLAVYVVWLIAGFGGEAATVFVSDVGLVLGAAVACGLCAARAVSCVGRARLAWGLMAGASLAWTLGEGLWTFNEVVLAVEVPFPSIADVAYLAAIPLAAFALFAFPAAPDGGKGRARVVLDGLIVVASLMLVSWGTVLGPLVRSGSDSLLGVVVGVAYPAGDVIILSAVAAVLGRSRSGARATIVLVGCGVGAVAIADSVYTFLTLQEEYVSGAPIDPLWLAGYLLIAFAAVMAREQVPAQRQAPQREEHHTRMGVVIPYVAVALALFVLGFKKTGGPLDPVTFWTGFAIVVLVVARQFIMRLETVALSHTLEQWVRERTAELDRTLEKLRASKLKEDAFVASTSHELRTLLTTIIGATATVLSRDEQLAPSSRELLAMVERAGARMGDLVEDLIAVAGLDGVNRDSSTVDLADVVGNVARAATRTGDALSIDVPRPLWARADANAVAAVLEHLLANARKFAPGSPVTITGSNGGHLARLTVSDAGPGIPPALRERIFERFFQGDGTSTRAHAGVGLGLFLARSLASSMGGTLEAVELPGAGASFRLTLPAVFSPEAGDAFALRVR